jgi:hypothetical protein
MICTQCGCQQIKTITPGHFIMEVVLWGIGLFFWPLLLVGFIYTVWRHLKRHKGCAACGGVMIPINSPVGRELCRKAQENAP